MVSFIEGLVLGEGISIGEGFYVPLVYSWYLSVLVWVEWVVWQASKEWGMDERF
jgi:hypothetical protein